MDLRPVRLLVMSFVSTVAIHGGPLAEAEDLTAVPRPVLRALKFDPGPLDGVKGPLTSAAVRRFQESSGDRATGEIGLKTLIRLRQATGAPE